MNFESWNWWRGIRDDERIGNAGVARRAVLLVAAGLDAHADYDTGRAWASQRRLAREVGLSRNTVARALRELEAFGWLRRLPHRAPEDAQTYALVVAPLPSRARTQGTTTGKRSLPFNHYGSTIEPRIEPPPGSTSEPRRERV